VKAQGKNNKYLSKRIAIFKEYISSCNYQESQIFSPTRLLAFITFHKNKQKALLTTHLNEVLKQLALLSANNLKSQFLLDSHFNVKSRLDFQLLASNSQRKNQRPPQDLSIFTVNNFKALWSLHSVMAGCEANLNNNDIYACCSEKASVCRAIVQAAMSLRFANTLNLNLVRIVTRRCVRCSDQSTCAFVMEDCYHKVYYADSKNGTAFFTYIIPEVLKCYTFLCKLEKNTAENSSIISSAYNNFLKNNFTCTSHKLRKFLINLQDLDQSKNKTNQLGNWRSREVMNNHYVQHLQKFVLLQKLFHSF